jgi:CheY-like chemotaxis protein
MVQVLTNLLTNAAKYTPVHGNINVHLSINSDSVLLAVIDDGIGIAPELLPRVFELFTQAERTMDRAQGGLGIGLALVKSLVELHSGTVKAISHPATKGSRFEIKLPRINAETIESQPLMRPTGNEKRILIVDDNEDAANMLSLLLQTSGHMVSVVYTARDAIDHVNTEIPEVILLDIGLPEMDGITLAKHFRSMSGMAHVLIVAVTGYGADENRKEALSSGFDDHLVKPIDVIYLENLFLKNS